jgi:hypothetical protein
MAENTTGPELVVGRYSVRAGAEAEFERVLARNVTLAR